MILPCATVSCLLFCPCTLLLPLLPQLFVTTPLSIIQPPMTSQTSQLSASSSSSSSSSKKRTRDLPSSPPPSSTSPPPPASLVVDDSPDVFVPSTDTATIQDEYRVWKKNSPYLYDLVISSQLTWPSLTCQFLPDRSSLPGKEVVVQRLLLGTQTDGSERNYLMLAEIKLPSDDAVIDAEAFAKQEADHERAGDGTAPPLTRAGGALRGSQRRWRWCRGYPTPLR